MADVASLAVGLHLNAANFKTQLIGAYGDANKQSRQFNRQAQDDAKKTEEAYKRVTSTVSGLAGRIAGLAGVGFSLGAIIQTSRQYSQALSDLSSITGATGDKLRALDQAAQQMGRTTEYSASQAVEALKLMASAKPELLETADGLQKATNSALLLAQAGGSTLPDATRTLALSLNQFGAGAEQADRYINVLAAGAKFGASEINDTAAAIKNGGVAAAQAGIGFETLNAAIQVLASREIKGGEAGTALRNIILNLEKGTDKTLKPSVVGLSKALENLAGKNLSTAQAVKLFGVENINAASILTSNRGKLDELTKSLTGTQTAHEQAAVRVNNLNGDLMGLTSAFEGLIIKVGQSGNGPLRSGVQSITESVNALADNFNTVASVALYTLIPVLSTKLTAGLRESVTSWTANELAVRKSALQQAETAKQTIAAAQASRLQAQEVSRYLVAQKAANMQAGINVSYQKDFAANHRIIRESIIAETAATERLTAANAQLSITARAASVASGLARGALSLIGGPVGAAMLAGSAVLYFHEQAKQARQSALDLKGAVVETTAALMQLSDVKLSVKLDDYTEQLNNINTQREKVKDELSRYSDTRISLAKSREGSSLGFLFPSAETLEKEKRQLKGQLEDLDSAASTARDNITNATNARFLVKTGVAERAKALQSDIQAATAAAADAGKVQSPWSGEDPAKADKKAAQALKQFQSLRNEIEQAHASSLEKINLQEKVSQEKILKEAKASGVSQAEVQRVMTLNAANYQRQRQELAEQYSPAKAVMRQESEASRDLKQLYASRLITEQEYQSARITLANDSAQKLIQAQASRTAAPKLNIAGEVDPVAQLQNQLVQQQSLYDAYYANGKLSKVTYEALMQKSSRDSADAQYQAALNLYAGQSALNKGIVSLAEAATERVTNSLTGLLTGTQSFKDSISNLFASLAQSVIKSLVEMTAQALLTKTVLSSFMSFGGSAIGAVGSGVAASAGSIGAMGMSTSYQGYDSGGFTGVGGKNDPAGIVHKGEFVFTKEATERIGVSNLYDMMRGYADGGLVTAPTERPAASGVARSGGVTPVINIGDTVVHISGPSESGDAGTDKTASAAKQLQGIIRKEVNEWAKSQMTPGGVLYSGRQ
ncbi:tail protein [Pantoea ananatis]|uniref:phage tail tape measure protein n=1 Tax=Pantoea ananas TaxID=553 RepID=UPI0007375A64|nr:phage tail tape measure protein [Pantoea ananatis]KTR48007.1 tail protein [Pantoea ananatis]KTR54561.1 tail protein [Pantoea ananatis]KTR65257.1 tail protein [Pantoea ananatis]KTR72556.1 tail protein [Pantoea ananatis]